MIQHILCGESLKLIGSRTNSVELSDIVEIKTRFNKKITGEVESIHYNEIILKVGQKKKYIDLSKIKSITNKTCNQIIEGPYSQKLIMIFNGEIFEKGDKVQFLAKNRSINGVLDIITFFEHRFFTISNLSKNHALLVEEDELSNNKYKELIKIV